MCRDGVEHASSDDCHICGARADGSTGFGQFAAHKYVEYVVSYKASSSHLLGVHDNLPRLHQHFGVCLVSLDLQTFRS